jgi:hypothetical protein
VTAATLALSGYLAPSGAIKEIVLRCSTSRTERNLALYAASYLQRQLRCDRIRLHGQRELPEALVVLSHWQHEQADITSFDRLFEQLQREGDFRLVLWSRDWLEGVQAALELLNRYQRLLPLPLDYRPLPHLPELLSARRALFRDGQNEGRAGEDAWRWLLRLAPEPPRAVELAALFLDLLLPQHDNHTRAAWTTLESHGFRRAELLEMTELLSQLDRNDTFEPDLALLRDARGLAFFSTESWRYFREHGHAPTHEKLRALLAHMSARALCLALATRQPPDVSLMLEDILDMDSAPDSGVRRT